MDADAFTSIAVYKQRHEHRLREKNSKRRALNHARRMCLDTTPCTSTSITGSNTLYIPTNTNLDISNTNQHLEGDSYDESDEDKDDDLNELIPDLLYQLNTDECINDDEESLDNLMHHFNLSLPLHEMDTFLHDLTTLKRNEYCANLLFLLRKANICKSHADKFIQLIHTGLPIPNTMPKSMKDLLSTLQVESLFTKREICTMCHLDVNEHSNENTCNLEGKQSNTTIFDIDVNTVLFHLLNRLWPSILEYKNEIESNTANDYNDIPFNYLYQNMIQKISGETEFITIILHLDGISICKSTKLKLWLLSGIIVELHPRIVLQNGNICKIFFYGVVGDCPALKIILEIIGHNGYFSCFYCYIKGIHIGGRGGKRQYYFANNIQLRDQKHYLLESLEAAKTSSNIYGHLGYSILHEILDVPLPYSIIGDYLHVTLLRHTRCIVKQIYSDLTPSQRIKLDNNLRAQKFPHFFHRKVRAVCDFSFVKGTELKNLLLYALLPHLLPFISTQRLAHLALFVCFIRYYEDHEIYFDKLQNLVLHLHTHFDQIFNHHGSLCYLGTFSQEDFIGAISKNHHGSRCHGELIVYYYEIDFVLQNITLPNNSQNSHYVNGTIDPTQATASMLRDIHRHHLNMCGCDKPDECVRIFRRCLIDRKMYHSLIYFRRNLSVSYFVQYHNKQDILSFIDMASSSVVIRDKRLQHPRQIYSPSTTSVPLPSHYLIYIADTTSHLLVGRASIKNIHKNQATLVLNKRKFVGEIIFSGTFSLCQKELNKIQLASQSLNEDTTTDIDEVYDMENRNHNDEHTDEEEEVPNTQYDESDDEVLFNHNTSRKRKDLYSDLLTNDSQGAKRSKNKHSIDVHQDSSNDDDTQLNPATHNQDSPNTDKALRSIENKMNDFGKSMIKMSNVIHQLVSSSKTGSHNLDSYRDSNTQELFPSTVDYNGQNLIAIVAKDFGDYARQLMRELFSADELKVSVLPPRRPHLVRPALDPYRFQILNEAVRVKYRLGSHLYDDFFKYQLRPKLSDFLVEERRRESLKNARQQAKLALQTTGNQQTIN
ncbi:unnamed protein product [Adineta steineri]|uniref:Uncharacterized protein n=1 Tax=Adineta steineri TaxID=433720 RepID=A0A814RHJ3_9BILA|nr:unnamed protein product [Adineta steineri]